jgi:hypothetical protein
MTACLEDGTEGEFFDALMNKVVKASVEAGPKGSSELAVAMAQAHATAPRWSDWIEYRMVPSVAPKQKRKAFRPAAQP